MSVFDTDKVSLLIDYLTDKGVHLNPSRTRQQVSCFNKEYHRRGDRNPSASVDLVKGRYHCFACGISGDVFDLALTCDGIKPNQLVDDTDLPNPRKEDTWLL